MKSEHLVNCYFKYRLSQAGGTVCETTVELSLANSSNQCYFCYLLRNFILLLYGNRLEPLKVCCLNLPLTYLAATTNSGDLQ